MAKLITIDGVMGSGKSTTAYELSKLTGFPVIDEPWEKNEFIPRVFAGEPVVDQCQLTQFELLLASYENAVLRPEPVLIMDVTPWYSGFVWTQALKSELSFNVFSYLIERSLTLANLAQTSGHILESYCLIPGIKTVNQRIRGRNRPHEQGDLTGKVKRLHQCSYGALGNFEMKPIKNCWLTAGETATLIHLLTKKSNPWVDKPNKLRYSEVTAQSLQ